MSFFGAIPGFLPTVALTILAGAIVLIPMLVVGVPSRVPWIAYRGVARLAA